MNISPFSKGQTLSFVLLVEKSNRIGVKFNSMNTKSCI